MLEVITGEVQLNAVFLIDSFASPYNPILGRSWIHATVIVTSPTTKK